MKKNKQIIILLSTVLLTSLFIGNFALARNDFRYNPIRYNPFIQIWNAVFDIQSNIEDLQTKTSNLQSQETQTQTTIQNLQTQIVDLQTQINELKNSQTVTGTTRHVYEGFFDVFADGDLLIHKYAYSNPNLLQTTLHYKRIDVPELTLTDMPIIKVYTTPYTKIDGLVSSDEAQFLRQVWYEHDYLTAASGSVNSQALAILYGEGAVYIYYKSVPASSSGDPAVIIGNYKIVVTK